MGDLQRGEKITALKKYNWLIVAFTKNLRRKACGKLNQSHKQLIIFKNNSKSEITI